MRNLIQTSSVSVKIAQ